MALLDMQAMASNRGGNGGGGGVVSGLSVLLCDSLFSTILC
jgi:Lanthionine-containing peptide SapB precursor RamS